MKNETAAFSSHNHISFINLKGSPFSSFNKGRWAVPQLHWTSTFKATISSPSPHFQLHFVQDNKSIWYVWYLRPTRNLIQIKNQVFLRNISLDDLLLQKAAAQRQCTATAHSTSWNSYKHSPHGFIGTLNMNRSDWWTSHVLVWNGSSSCGDEKVVASEWLPLFLQWLQNERQRMQTWIHTQASNC